jgi:hypothetical protein
VVGVHPCRPSSYGRQGRASNSLKKKKRRTPSPVVASFTFY